MQTLQSESTLPNWLAGLNTAVWIHTAPAVWIHTAHLAEAHLLYIHLLFDLKYIHIQTTNHTPLSQYLWHKHFKMHKYSKKCQIHHFNVGIYASRNVCVKDIDSRASMVLQNYQKFIVLTSNMIYIVALGVGFKCPRKIHLNTQCPASFRVKKWYVPL